MDVYSYDAWLQSTYTDIVITTVLYRSLKQGIQARWENVSP